MDTTSNEWDFESVIELIRLQTQSIGSALVNCRVEPPIRPKELLEIPSQSTKDDMTRFSPLGDFEEIFQYFGHSSRESDGYVDTSLPLAHQDTGEAPSDRGSGPRSQFLAAQEPLNLAFSAVGLDDKPASSNEHDVDVGYTKKVLDQSLQRRKVIHNIMGLDNSTSDAKFDSQRKPTGLQASGKNKGDGSRIQKAPLLLPRPDNRLEILRILGLDGTTATSGLVKSPPKESMQNVLSFMPSQVHPQHQAVALGIHVFVDISNILIGFHDALKHTRGISRDVRIPRVPLSFFNLALILERGRPVAKRVLAGSDELESTQEARQMGYEVNLLKRVLKHKEPYPYKHRKAYHRETTSADSEIEEPVQFMRSVEQGVDEILHLKILESLLDNEMPSTMVLATGDAAEAEYSDGFLRMVERALKRGWKVELVAFTENMSAAYRNQMWAGQWHGAFTTLELDPFADLLRLN